MKNLFAGKSIKLLKDYRILGVNAEIGELVSGGSILKFGEDYLLIEGEGDKLVRVYDTRGILISQFEIE